MKYKIKRKTQKKINRSGKQHCDICQEPSILVSHHINGRDIPDANREWNICNICDNCHKKIHSDIIIIEGKFSTTNGLELFWHKQGERSITEEEAKPYIIPKNQTN